MNKKVILFIVFGLFSQIVFSKNENFEICNQTKNKIYYELEIPEGLLLTETMQLRPKSSISPKSMNNPIPTHAWYFRYKKAQGPKMIFLTLASDPDLTKNVAQFVLNFEDSFGQRENRPIETIFIKVLQKNGSFFVEAQKPRGPFGAIKKTCGELKLNQYKNITDRDITKVEKK